MRNIRIVVSFLLLCLGHAMLLAQTLTITGKVVDEEGLEVIGANIRVKGNASVGTITGLDGAYSIRAGAKMCCNFLLSAWRRRMYRSKEGRRLMCS